MNGDTDKKMIGRFGNGAKLFCLTNRAGATYYTIEVDGVEFYSVEKRNGEPGNMVRFYEKSNRTKLREF